MKTRQYIFAMLIALIFGIVSIQAQSARRAAPQQKKERAAVSRTTTQKATPQKARTAQTSREVQKQQMQRSKATSTRATARKATPQNNRTVQANRQIQKQQVQKQQAQRSRAANTRVNSPKATPQNNRAVQTNRQAQRQQAQRQSTPQVQRQQVQRQSTPQVQRQRANQTARKPVSISTPNNPRSTYRSPRSTVYATPNRVNKYSTKRYYGGHHYHYVYPTRRVKIHYHYDTYIHNYHVLYYPTYRDIYWTRHMYRNYARWYPGYTWRYNWGYRINTISVFEAKFNLGEVAMVYGRVYATWYNAETNDYLLFFGGDFPDQQFTVVLPGRVARRFSWRPERFFLGQHITVTGLITTFDGIPEIIVKNKRQIGLY